MKPEASAPAGAEPPVALFTMRHSEPEPANALVVALGPGGDHAVVTDIRDPEGTQRMPLV